MDSDLRDVKSGKQHSGHSKLKNRKDLKKQGQKTVVFFAIALLLWAGLIVGGYFFYETSGKQSKIFEPDQCVTAGESAHTGGYYRYNAAAA